MSQQERQDQGADNLAVRTPTLLERLTAALDDPDKARRWIEAGAVMVGGERVSDPDLPMTEGLGYAINPK